MRLQKVKYTFGGETYFRYFFGVPRKLVDHCGWKKGDKFSIIIENKDTVIIRRDKPENGSKKPSPGNDRGDL